MNTKTVPITNRKMNKPGEKKIIHVVTKANTFIKMKNAQSKNVKNLNIDIIKNLYYPFLIT